MDAKDEVAVVRRWLEAFEKSGLGPEKLAALHLLARLRAIEGGLHRVLDPQPVSGRDNGNVGQS